MSETAKTYSGKTSIIAFFFALTMITLTPPASRAETSSHRVDAPLKILICLDGVPLSLMQKIRDEGRFDSFAQPAPLISTFPAITEVMLTELFNVDPPPGYGLRYYDKDSNELRGGLGDASAISIWFKLYDFVTPMIDRGITYLWARWSERDLDYLRKYLKRSDTGILMMHLDSTDALMHHERAEVTERWLRRLDRVITDFLAARRGRDIEIVLFSDHGNDMTPTRRIPIEDHLRRSGWNPSSVINGESGVAILPTGLISTGYLYTAREEEVARDLAKLRGVDLCLYETTGIAMVIGRNGQARIDRRERPEGGWRYRYQRDSGDPLAMAAIMDAMKDSGLLDASGFADDREWFAATLTHTYPDALNRIYAGVTGHVENVGDVLMSMDPGWHCGSKALSTFLKFQGTHGSLRRASITGFVISSRRDLPPLRAEELLDRLGWRDDVESDAGTRGVKIMGHREAWDERHPDAVY